MVERASEMLRLMLGSYTLCVLHSRVYMSYVLGKKWLIVCSSHLFIPSFYPTLTTLSMTYPCISSFYPIFLSDVDDLVHDVSASVVVPPIPALVGDDTGAAALEVAVEVGVTEGPQRQARAEERLHV